MPRSGPRSASCAAPARSARPGTACEPCHGRGSTHIQSGSKADIFNPRNASKAEADKVCGYCHIRGENTQWLTAQGNHSEYMPHPVQGESYRAGQDDWTKWYPDKLLLPGIQPDDPIGRNYPNTDLNNAFFIDEKAQKDNSFDARKHHEEYQEFIQSSHYKNNLLSCSDCHSPHSVKNKAPIKAKETCKGCHGTTYDVDKIMPAAERLRRHRP